MKIATKTPEKRVNKRPNERIERAIKFSNRGKGDRLNDAQRLEIINRFKDHPNLKKTKIAKEFGISEGAIRHILKSADEYLSRMKSSPSLTRLRFIPAKYNRLEESLYQWVCGMRSQSVTLPPMYVKQKALEIAKVKNIEEFTASNGWYEGFIKRYQLKSIQLFGEGGSLDKSDPALLQQLDDFYAELSKYHPDHIYNMDETGLFYRMLPRYTILVNNEDRHTVRGEKASKDRVSIALCTNATGNHKLPLFMIGNVKEPACIRGYTWPVEYCQQQNAWQDNRTFLHWLQNVFTLEVRKRTGRDVLLIVDNATSHSVFDYNGVRVIFLPANVTSWKQPCDQGIIASFKKLYKYKILGEIIAFHDQDQDDKARLTMLASKMRRGAAGVKYGRHAHLLDAARLAKDIWDQVSSTTIRNCFVKADIIKDWKDEIIASEDENDVTNFDPLISKLVELKLIPESETHKVETEIADVLVMDNADSEVFLESLSEAVESILSSTEVHAGNENDMYTDEDDTQQQCAYPVPPSFLAFKDKLTSLEDDLLIFMKQDLNRSEIADFQHHLDNIFSLKKFMVCRERATKKQVNPKQLTLYDCISKSTSCTHSSSKSNTDVASNVTINDEKSVSTSSSIFEKADTRKYATSSPLLLDSNATFPLEWISLKKRIQCKFNSIPKDQQTRLLEVQLFFPDKSMVFNYLFLQRVTLPHVHCQTVVEEPSIAVSRKDLVNLILNKYTWNSILHVFMRRYITFLFYYMYIEIIVSYS